MHRRICIAESTFDLGSIPSKFKKVHWARKSMYLKPKGNVKKRGRSSKKKQQPKPRREVRKTREASVLPFPAPRNQLTGFHDCDMAKSRQLKVSDKIVGNQPCGSVSIKANVLKSEDVTLLGVVHCPYPVQHIGSQHYFPNTRTIEMVPKLNRVTDRETMLAEDFT